MCKRKVKQFFAALLTIIILLPIFAACSGGGDAQIQDTTAPVTEETTAAETRNPYLDDISETFDFEGEVFTISLPLPSELGEVYYIREELTGDALNDAIYTRNLEVEQRFNCVINTRTDGWTHDQASALMPTLLAGDDSVDLVALGFMQGGVGFITNDLAYPLNMVPYIDMKKPYWNQNIVDSLSVGDNVYILIGDINWTTMCETAVCFFNKQVQQDMNIPNLYELVDNGKWTFEMLQELASGISADIDGDGKFNENDRYGCIQNLIVGIYSYQLAADTHTVIKEKDGPKLQFNTEKMQSILEYLIRLCYDDNTSYVDSFDYANSSKGVKIFFDNRALFLLATLEHGEYFRQFDADFGIVPYPKYDEGQENYRSTSDQWGLSCVIPKTATNLTFNGVITEALCSGSAIHITNTYYNKVLIGKQTRDEESARMLDIVFDNLIYDFGICYCTNLDYMPLPSLVSKKSTDLTSWFAKRESALKAQYQKLYDYAESQK